MSMNRTTGSKLLVVAFGVATLFANGCANKGVPFVAAAKKTAPRNEMQFSVARASEQEGNLANAIQVYEALYAATPEDAEVCHRLGIVKLRMGKASDGITYLMEAEALRPGDAAIKGDLGYGYILLGEYDIAEKFLRESLNIVPGDNRAVNNLAMAVGYQGRMDESYTLYRTVMDDAEAHSNIGYIYSQTGRSDLAMKHYNKALDINPTLKMAAEALVQMDDITMQVASIQSQEEKSEIQLTNGTAR